MKLEKLKQMVKEAEEKRVCKICRNIGYYKDNKGTCRMCLDCLNKGKYDQDLDMQHRSLNGKEMAVAG